MKEGVWNETIQVKGAKTHNLKNIHFEIPRGQITSVVGVSGAGKSSLAFHTLYAESYLRYIESISPYIRQFLDKIEKPNLDSVEGLPPAIAFKYKKSVKNSRSIVATSLDIFDYFRILFAKISIFFCPHCGVEVKKYSAEEITNQLLENPGDSVDICFEYKGSISFLLNRGYYFHLKDGERKKIDGKLKDKSIHVLIDRLVPNPEEKSRLFEALETSIGFNRNKAILFKGEKKIQYPTELSCAECGSLYDSPDESLFSFNSPKGACPECQGFGDVQRLDPAKVFDPQKTLIEGAVIPLNTRANSHFKGYMLQRAQERGIDIRTPLHRLNKDELEFITQGDRNFEGLEGFFAYLKSKSYKISARVFLSRYIKYVPCPQCKGQRLNPLALAFKIRGKSIGDLLAMRISEAQDFFKQINPLNYKDRVSPSVFEEICLRLNYLIETGLPYLHLNRHTHTLSKGESQRINLAFILGSTLSDSLLIIDQPSADLHPIDFEKIQTFLHSLKQNNNTVLLIEHNPEMVRFSDHVLELGPLSGDQGGHLVFNGPKTDFFSGKSTLTQSFFTRSHKIRKPTPPSKGWLSFSKAQTHNLKNFDFRIPLNRLTVITGVSGAGKTTLLKEEILKNTHPRKNIKEVVLIEPSHQKVRANSIVAGFFQLFSPIRDLFAGLKESRVQPYTAGHFSFNSHLGRCPQCKGNGYTETEMQFLPAMKTICNLCQGSGYKPEVLKIKYKEYHIRGFLDLSIHHSLDLLKGDLPRRSEEMMQNICDSGLGYLKLGQKIKELSEGELQRMNLLKYLNIKQKHSLFLVDELSVGLHPYDLEQVYPIIQKLMQNQNTLVITEHHPDIILQADYIIELGPVGGEEGGHLIFEGSPESLILQSASPTGSSLKKFLKKG